MHITGTTITIIIDTGITTTGAIGNDGKAGALSELISFASAPAIVCGQCRLYYVCLLRFDFMLDEKPIRNCGAFDDRRLLACVSS